jgi:glycosyltransferase involved in cell wall biosynthesis
MLTNIDKNLQISILIPCYNCEKTLDRLFKSIMKQTYPKKYITIIALNDGSTDNTYEKLKE